MRLSLIDFYGRNKMNCYLYGPKDDPYHSCPNWRLPYPEQEARQIRELVEACNRNRVDFVWAIHPGQDIKWNEEDYNNLVRKFEMMYDLGVRSFAIFFDDISGEGTNPVKQTELLNRLNEEFVRAKGDVAPLTVCVTDYARYIVMQGPVYGLDTTLTAGEVCGVVSNPMEHGEASKLALYGVADYTWNTADFNAIDNWERGIEALTPEAADAYRTFAIHSCDTETGYRRAESWETRTFRIAEYTQEEYDALLREFLAIEQVPARMEAGCRNKALLGELRPWLTEFGKLGTRGRKTLELIKTYEAGDDEAFWAAYVGNLMTEQERKDYEAHKSGTMKLQPFYENAMDDMVAGFFTRLTGDVPASYKGIGTFANVRTTLSKLMFDNDSTTFYTSGMAQKEGDWTGADLGRVRDVEEVRILQGRNSVDDVDYFDHAVVEYSEDGKTWTPLTGELEKQYVINWSGEPVRARYVRLKRLESPRTNWASVRSFEVNPVRAERLGFEIEAEDAAQALYAFDRNPGTSYENRGVLKFGIPEGTKQYTLLLKLPAEGAVTVRQLAADGTVDRPFAEVAVAEGAATIELEGQAEVFEILAR